jgi:glucokinase-like ROK family protein
MDNILVFDIGGTSIKYGIISSDGVLLESKETPTRAMEGGPEVIRRTINIAKTYSGFSHIGISTTGQVDCTNGSIIFAADNIPHYTGYKIRKMFQKDFSVPIAVINDVNAVALAEVHNGSGKGYQNVLCLTYGTGIGGAVVIDGNIYLGSNGSAGEFGHMATHGKDGIDCTCGNRGCYEVYASTRALVKSIEKATGQRLSGIDIFQPSRRDDPVFSSIIEAWTDEIAIGLSGLCHAFDPDCVILGGGIMQQKCVFDSVRKKVLSRVMPSYRDVTVKQAALGNTAGLFGAYLAAVQL